MEEGDSLKINLTVNAAKDIDYIHIQSPIDPITKQIADNHAGIEMRDGLSIEKDFKNNSANFFIEKLKTGQYTFTYKLVANQAGDFKNGKVMRVDKVY